MGQIRRARPGRGSATEPVPPAASPPLVSLAQPRLVRVGDAQRPAVRAAVRVRGDRRRRGDRPRHARRVRPRRTSPSSCCGASAAHGSRSRSCAHHDVRYTMGADRLRRRARHGVDRAAAAALAGASANARSSLAVVGGTARRDVRRRPRPGQLPLSNGAIHEGEGVPPRDRVVVYSSLDYLVSGPLRERRRARPDATPARRRRRPHRDWRTAATSTTTCSKRSA